MRVVQTLGRVDKSTSGAMVRDFPKSVPRILGVRIHGFWPPESFRYVLSIPEGFWGSKSADFMYRHSFLLCTLSEGFWGSKSADSGCYPSRMMTLRILLAGLNGLTGRHGCREMWWQCNGHYEVFFLYILDERLCFTYDLFMDENGRPKSC